MSLSAHKFINKLLKIILFDSIVKVIIKIKFHRAQLFSTTLLASIFFSFEQQHFMINKSP